MTNDAGKLSYIKPYHGNDIIYVGDGNSLSISHTGEININTQYGQLNLKDVLVVPDLKKHLLSVGKLTTDNVCTLEFTSSDFVVKDRHQRVIARGRKKGQLYALGENSQYAFSAIRKGAPSASLWHQRLGHLNVKILPLLKEKKVIDVSHWMSKPLICTSCQMGKSCKLPFNSLNKFQNCLLRKYIVTYGDQPLSSRIKGFDFM